MIKESDFRRNETVVPALKDGQILVLHSAGALIDAKHQLANLGIYVSIHGAYIYILIVYSYSLDAEAPNY
jgi:hypothetical protein